MLQALRRRGNRAALSSSDLSANFRRLWETTYVITYRLASEVWLSDEPHTMTHIHIHIHIHISTYTFTYTYTHTHHIHTHKHIHILTHFHTLNLTFLGRGGGAPVGV